VSYLVRENRAWQGSFPCASNWLAGRIAYTGSDDDANPCTERYLDEMHIGGRWEGIAEIEPDHVDEYNTNQTRQPKHGQLQHAFASNDVR